MKRAVFIDRDGTLAHEVGYINHISRFRLYSFAVDAVRLINRSGWLAVLVTNQSGVARGLFPESLLDQVHESLRVTLAAGDAHLDAIYYCPHHPTAGVPPYRRDCVCRKPRPGLLHQAASDLGVDLARSYMIGDRVIDLETAWNAGARGVLVKTGYGRGELEYQVPLAKRPPDLVAENLIEAVKLVCAKSGADESR
ncbi:MAG: HAD family hydrolase [Vicinamibacteria bacterium]|nr:HAD family hydrolase [Vicinamibacteria bacterium]